MPTWCLNWVTTHIFFQYLDMRSGNNLEVKKYTELVSFDVNNFLWKYCFVACPYIKCHKRITYQQGVTEKLVHFGHPTWYILFQVYYDAILNIVICLIFTNKKLNKRGLINCSNTQYWAITGLLQNLKMLFYQINEHSTKP